MPGCQRRCNWTAGPVPKDSLFVMGDNRANSADSSVHVCLKDDGCDPQEGYVGIDLVVGKVFALAWPPGRAEFIGRADAFEDVPDPSLEHLEHADHRPHRRPELALDPRVLPPGQRARRRASRWPRLRAAGARVDGLLGDPRVPDERRLGARRRAARRRGAAPGVRRRRLRGHLRQPHAQGRRRRRRPPSTSRCSTSPTPRRPRQRARLDPARAGRHLVGDGRGLLRRPAAVARSDRRPALARRQGRGRPDRLRGAHPGP